MSDDLALALALVDRAIVLLTPEQTARLGWALLGQQVCIRCGGRDHATPDHDWWFSPAEVAHRAWVAAGCPDP